MNANNIGTFLRAYREKRGLNVKEVQRIFLDEYDMKVSEKTIYNWERSQYNLSVPKLLTLCEIYDIPLPEPVSEMEAKKHSQPAVTPKELQLINAYRKHPDVQSAVDKLLDIAPKNPDSQLK